MTRPAFATATGGQVGRWSRRRFLARNALGLGSVSLAWLLREDNLLATPPNMTASRSPLTSSPRSRCSVRKPASKPKDRARTPVDAFLVDALAKLRLGFSPEAERITLLRRACLDLTGLPPTPAEVEAFLADAAPDAYERLIDRLLDSPHYGECWGRQRRVERSDVRPTRAGAPGCARPDRHR